MVNILDPNALNALTAVEGQRWRDYQEENRSSPYCFYRFLAAAKWREANPEMADVSIMDVVAGGLDGRTPAAHHCMVSTASLDISYDGMERLC